MSIEALVNISRKKLKLADVQSSAEQSRRKWLAKEAEAVEDLENTIALVIDSRASSLTQVANEMNASRDKIKAMADRARKRNRELLRKGTN